jgi:hypothetical protein
MFCREEAAQHSPLRGLPLRGVRDVHPTPGERRGYSGGTRAFQAGFVASAGSVKWRDLVPPAALRRPLGA